MIKQNPVRGMQPVALPVIHRDPVRVHLRRRIRTARIKWSRLLLRHFLHQPIHLRARSLIKSRLRCHLPHRIEQPNRPQPCHIPRELRNIKTHPHMTLGRQIINLVRLSLPQNLDHRTRIAQIPEMQKDLCPLLVSIPINRIEPLGIKARRATNNSMHLIPLLQQQLCQIRAILTRNTRDQCLLRHTPYSFSTRDFALASSFFAKRKSSSLIPPTSCVVS